MVAPPLDPDLRAELAGLAARIDAESRRSDRLCSDHGDRLPKHLNEAIGAWKAASLELILAIVRTKQGIVPKDTDTIDEASE